MQYTEKDVAQLIANVEEAFTAQLAKAKESSLAKSEDGEKDHKEEEKPEHKEEAPKHEAEEESEEHEEGKHDEKPEHEDEKSHEEGHDYDKEDLEHMEKMYRSMSKGELAAHHDCLKKCMGGEASSGIMSKNEAEDHKNGGEISACEPKDVPGAKSPASKAEGVQMEKSEKPEIELLKTELEAEKAAKADLKKNFEAVQEFLTHLVKKTVPQGKAITSLDVIAKSEAPSEVKTPTKSKILEILKEKTADPSLKKSDRDAINTFYLNGQVNVGSISHLLK